MPSLDTTHVGRDAAGARRGRSLRRIGLAILVLVVALGATDWLGTQEGTVEATAGGVSLRVLHPTITRPSNVVPLSLRIEPTAGFGEGPVKVAVDAAIFDRFDFQNWYPNPSAETATEDQVRYEFDPPPGPVLLIRLDARLGPNQGFSTRTYTVAVLDSRDVPVVSVEARMTVLP